MKPAAIRATYSDWRLVKTRQVVQIVFEVPLAEADQAYEVIGGMPNPSNERWFGIAPLDLTKRHIDAKPKRNWHELPAPQQAGIRCDEPVFTAFLKEQYPDDWHESQEAAACVRLICGVSSRSELSGSSKWRILDDRYQAWKAIEGA